LNKKSVQITTLIMSLLLFAATCIPTVMTLFKSEKPVDPNPAIIDIGNAGIILQTVVFTPQELKFYVGDKVVFYTVETALKEDVQSGKRSTGFVIDSLTSFKSIVKNKEMYSSSSEMMKFMLQTINTNRNLLAAGIDPAKVQAASNVTITTSEIVLGKDANNSFLITYLLMFAVYMLVIMYGSFVSTSVAREKDSRTMEILITSTKPDALIVGKVLANGVAGLVQFTVVFGTAMIGYLINQSSFPSIVNTMLFGSLSWDAILVFLVFTALGYLLYLFVYASLGSLVSKVEDVGSSVSIITLVFMVAYLIASFGMQMPNSLMVKVGSYVPFTAILAMPIRYFLTAVPVLELIISLTLMALTTWLFAIISIRIYRLGSLSYGNKMGLIKALKAIFSAAK
jgi:ABC-2 type transport system permease protein